METLAHTKCSLPYVTTTRIVESMLYCPNSGHLAGVADSGVSAVSYLAFQSCVLASPPCFLACRQHAGLIVPLRHVQCRYHDYDVLYRREGQAVTLLLDYLFFYVLYCPLVQFFHHGLHEPVPHCEKDSSSCWHRRGDLGALLVYSRGVVRLDSLHGACRGWQRCGGLVPGI